MAEASITSVATMIVIFAICAGIWFAVRAARPKIKSTQT